MDELERREEKVVVYRIIVIFNNFDDFEKGVYMISMDGEDACPGEYETRNEI